MTFGTGTGGVGTYMVDQSQTFAISYIVAGAPDNGPIPVNVHQIHIGSG